MKSFWMSEMSWNYRIIKRTYPNSVEIYAIHEVYYTSGDARATTVQPCWPQGETLEELKEDFEWYRKALEKPVLDYEDFGDDPLRELCGDAQ